jgi:hypothetical protein
MKQYIDVKDQQLLFSKMDRITLGELMLDVRTSGALTSYLDNKFKINRYFKLKHTLSKKVYGTQCHIPKRYRTVLVEDFLKHFKVEEFHKMNGVGKKTCYNVVSNIELYGYNIIN